MDAELERSKLLTEAKRIIHEEESRAFLDRLAAENTATPASVQRLFVERAIPLLAEQFARSANNMRYTVFNSGGAPGSGDHPFNLIFAQIAALMNDILDQKSGQAPK